MKKSLVLLLSLVALFLCCSTEKNSTCNEKPSITITQDNILDIASSDSLADSATAYIVYHIGGQIVASAYNASKRAGFTEIDFVRMQSNPFTRNLKHLYQDVAAATR